MESKHRRYREKSWLWRIGVAAAACFLLVVVVLLLIPVWFPWVASPVAARWGVTWEEYERIGFSRFAVHEMRYSEDNVAVEARRTEGFTPMVWAWRGLVGKKGGDGFVAEVEGWRLKVDRVDPDEPPEEVSVYDVFERIDRNLDSIIRWFPQARFRDGSVEIDEYRVEAPLIEWQRGLLTAEVWYPALEQSLRFRGDLTGGSPYLFSAGLDPFPLETDVRVDLERHGVTVASETRIAGNLVEVSAGFSTTGYIPREAVFRSENFRVPREYFAIEGYDELAGSALISWRDGAFAVNIDGEAQPVSGGLELPPVRAVALARGDMEAIRVETLDISSPWLSASLSDPVAIDYSGVMLSDYSVFSVDADLAAQPFVDVGGRVRGEVRLWPGESLYPEGRFNLSGEGIEGFDAAFSRLEATGDFAWPVLTVERMDAEFAGERTSILRAFARIGLDSHELLAGEVDGVIYPDALAPWLPDEMNFASMRFSGSAAGPWNALEHRGEVELEGLSARALANPGATRVDWRGRFADIDDLSVRVDAAETRADLSGGIAFSEEWDGLRAEVRRFSLSRAGEVQLASNTRTTLDVNWADGFGGEVRELDWEGPAGGLRADGWAEWPDRGQFEIDIADLHPRVVRDFFQTDLEQVHFDWLYLVGDWDGGPIAFSAHAGAGLLADGDPVLFEVAVDGDSDGVRVERLRAGTEREPLVVASGRFPIMLDPRRAFPLVFDLNGEVDFVARTEPDADFWEEVGEWIGGVRLGEPALELAVHGTPRRPTGELRASATEIVFPGGDGRIPRVEDLDIHIGLDPDEFLVREGRAFVEGQRIDLFGRFPMGPNAWQRLFQNRQVPDWRAATARIAIADGDFGVAARHFPDLLSPQGTIELDLQLRDGGMYGHLAIDGVATRPLRQIGVLDEGRARIRFEGTTARVTEVSALLGGEQATVTGTIHLPIEEELGFDLALEGSNLPLVRQPGRIFRGDLDLNIRGTGEEQPRISGDVRLRESYYLAHLQLMPTGAVATPQRRPPFFSIDREPFNDWRLDINLRGSRFLNVRGPVFRGEISANFNLGGTLEEPVAIGDLTIDSGTIRFPFAFLHVDQGVVSLRRDDPFRPRLFVIATAKAFGYDVRLELTGTAEQPIVEFSSTPPLTSEQVLLMVTAGELPRDEFAYTAQQRAGRFAFYLGQNLLYEITGDDRAAERLIVRSGEDISEQGRETFSVEYRLGRDLSVIGEYNRFDEYTAGFKWNFFSR